MTRFNPIVKSPFMWDDFAESLESMRKRNRLRQLTPRSSQSACVINESGTDLINFGTNDYLGMAGFVQRASKPCDTVGARASALVSGWTERHQLLAERLARFESTETAVVFPSGFASCSGVISCLAGKDDLILSDELNHASLIDGCRLSRATRIVYPHRQTDYVQQVLSESRDRYHRVWIVTDTVFSMDGHVAPLKTLCQLAADFDATMLVDEAHATGVLGSELSGACEAVGVKDQTPIRLGTLSKAFGGQGGFVVCPAIVAQYIVNHCRPLIYSTALSLPAVEAAIAALDHTDEMKRRRERVCQLAKRVRDQMNLAAEGLERNVPIIPVVLGSDSSVVSAAEKLRTRGLFVPAIRPPTVPEGQARLRISLSFDHTDSMIARLIDGLRSI